MSFPFSISGRLSVVTNPRASDPSTVAAHIAEAIESERPRSVRRLGTVVTFRGGVFRPVWNWNILVPISSGTIDVELAPSGTRILYTLRFTELFVFATAITGLFALLAMSEPAGTTALDRAFEFSLPFIWLYGANVAIAMFRFPRFLERASHAV